MKEVDLLILGAGWTSTFLIPLLSQNSISFAATTRDGRKVAHHSTLKWTFNPDSSDTSSPSSSSEKSQFSSLPPAKSVLITFPLTSTSQTSLLVTGYTKAHHSSSSSPSQPHFIQLGSTGIWQGIPQPSIWTTRASPYDTSNKRAQAEDELLRLGGSVLNLAGLHGGKERNPRKWVNRVAPQKDDVRNKKSLHLVHGLDVARGVLAVLGKWDRARGQRWMLTDGLVYDWWELFVGWADQEEEQKQQQQQQQEGTNGEEEREKEEREKQPSKQAKWVSELMWEENVLALPRSMEVLGRCYDSRDFWHTFELAPLKARV
ncbi:hypothetical protein SMMN14_01802 [Sphaerulina musiva]